MLIKVKCIDDDPGGGLIRLTMGKEYIVDNDGPKNDPVVSDPMAFYTINGVHWFRRRFVIVPMSTRECKQAMRQAANGKK